MYSPSLSYFIVLADKLNFSSAAKTLHISQQSLSAYLQKLEEFYRVQLLERRPKVKLTAAGSMMLEAAKRIDKINDTLRDDLLMVSQNIKMKLIIGVGRPNSNQLLQFFPMAQYRQKYPKITFTIIEDLFASLIEQLSNDKLDLVIGSLEPNTHYHEYEEQVISTDNEYILISEQTLKKYFSDSYPACISTFQQGIRLREFSQIPMVMYPEISAMRKLIENYLKTNHLSYTIISEIPDRSITLHLIQTSSSVGFCNKNSLPSLNIDPVSDMPKVYAFPITEPSLQRDIAVIYKKKQTDSKYFSELLDLIIS